MKGEEKKQRLGLADALLILLALAAILTILLYSKRGRETEHANEFLCTLRLASVETAFLEAHGGELIPVGSVVRSENGTAELGRVVSVSAVPHNRAVLREGVVQWEADHTYSDMELTVRMQGIAKGYDGVRVKDLRIAAGGKGNFRIGNYYAAGVEILTVKAVEAA